jgi:hypothetical protein
MYPERKESSIAVFPHKVDGDFYDPHPFARFFPHSIHAFPRLLRRVRISFTLHQLGDEFFEFLLAGGGGVRAHATIV